MYADIAEMLRRVGLWFLTNVPANADLSEEVACYRAGVEALRGTASTLISEDELEDRMAYIGALMAAGVPEDLAHDVAALPLWSTAPELGRLAHARSLDIDLVAGAYFAIGTILGSIACAASPHTSLLVSTGDRLAIRRIVDYLYASQRELTAQVLQEFERDPVDRTRAEGVKAADAWANAHADMIARTQSFLRAPAARSYCRRAEASANSQICELAA